MSDIMLALIVIAGIVASSSLAYITIREKPCRFLKVCKEKVTFTEYSRICTRARAEICPHRIKYARIKLPKEWEELSEKRG